MSVKQILLTLLSAVVLLLTVGLVAAGAPARIGLAQAPAGTTPEPAPLSVQADLAQGFYYQGVLSENGKLIDGSRGMEFTLWDSPAGGKQVGATTSQSVEINQGYFDLALRDWGANEFDGSNVYLQVRAQDATGAWYDLGRTLIRPVPYAQSLVPGAHILGNRAGSVLTVENRGTGDAVTALAQGVEGRGMYAEGGSHGVEALGVGGSGVSASTLGAGDQVAGVYGQAGDSARGVMGVNTGNFDGVYGRSEGGPGVTAVSRSGKLFSGWDADPFSERFSVSNAGDVSYGGALIGALARPVYDSGWVTPPSVPPEAGTVNTHFEHNVGGNLSDYFVDAQCGWSGPDGQVTSLWGGVPNLYWSATKGFEFFVYGSTADIQMWRTDSKLLWPCTAVRLRIWLIK